MAQVKKYLVGAYHEAKPWIFFIIYCLFGAGLMDSFNVGIGNGIIFDAFYLYIFGSMGWVIIEALMKERHEYRMK